MRYVFIGLLLANAAMFGYYTFLHEPDQSTAGTSSTSLINPVNVTNVSNELPPMIGEK